MKKITRRTIHCIADGRDYVAIEGPYGSQGLTVTISPPNAFKEAVESFDFREMGMEIIKRPRRKVGGHHPPGPNSRRRSSVVEYREGINIGRTGARHK
ncbi:MAG: hypothetical protein ACE5J1_03165 [Nitrospiria bacterium]